MAGVELEGNDFIIFRVIRDDSNFSVKADVSRFEAVFAEDMVVLLDMASHPELIEEGLSLER